MTTIHPGTITPCVCMNRSSGEYYYKSSCGYNLQDINIPTLFINAKNDPIVPIRVIQEDDYYGNPYLCSVVTRYGAHSMDYLLNVFGTKQSWTANLGFEYLNSVLMLETRGQDNDMTSQIQS